jgi:tetratricopeptide (TPR) repeat protein
MRGLVLLVGLGAPLIAGGSSSSQAEKLGEIQLLVQQGNLAEAKRQLVNGLEEFPNFSGYYDLLGVVEAEEGNYVSAEQDFLKAIELDQLLIGAYLNLGRLYQQNSANDHEAPLKALTTYAKVLKFAPANAEANYQSAALLESRKAYRMSLEHLSRLPKADQEKAQALSVRCADLVGLGERLQAGAAADRLLHSADLAEADILLIMPMLEANHWDDLEQRLLEGAVKGQVAGFDTLGVLGRLYERQGELDEARATLERTAQANPQSTETLIELARIAEKQKDYTGALGYLTHASDLDPQDPAIHFFIGIVCVEENLLEESFKSLKQAVQLAPDNPYYNYALGVVAQQRADPHEAIPYFKKYRVLRPDDPRGNLQLGITYFNSHQDDLAVEELQTAAHHRETAAAAHFFLGRIANQKGDSAVALHELQQALDTEPDYADPYAEEGIIFLKQKDYPSAEKALSRALVLDPDHYVANLNLMMLYQRRGDQRAEEQTKRFEEVKKKRAEKAKLSLRSIQIVR